jgi:peptidoglycan-associated lipoprotein
MSLRKFIMPGAVTTLTALTALTLAACSSVDLAKAPDESTPPAAAAQPETPAAQSAAAAAPSTPAPAPAAQAQTITIDNVARRIYFDYDSSAIKPEFLSLVEAHAKYLSAHPDSKVTIEGHTDERGGREYNLALGQRRADALRKRLELLGVQDTQIETISYGKEKPAAAGSNEAAWAKNRRDVIDYAGGSASSTRN